MYVCFLVATLVDDLCLNLMFGYVVIGNGKSVCAFVLPCVLMIGA